jgi:hypothetical protein
MKILFKIFTLLFLPLMLWADGYSTETHRFAPGSTITAETDQYGADTDSFGRFRISTPFILFNSHQCQFQESNYWNVSTTGSGASDSWDSNFVSNTLTSGTAANGSAIYQTRTYWPYFSGMSQQCVFSGNFMGSQSGVIKRYGIFDDNNGCFFMLSGTALSVVVRSNTSGSVVDTIVPQSSWNLDHLDGTGQSTYSLDTTKSQIFTVDFQWLGVGKVRFGVQTPLGIAYCHVVYNNNVRTGVYMKNPNLPIRAQITNNNTSQGSAPAMSQICAYVGSEGAAGNFPTDGAAVTNPIAPSTGVWLPLIAVRVNPTYTRGVAIRPSYSWAGTLGNSIGLEGLFFNAQISGGSWITIPGSIAEYNNSATAMTITNTACVTVHTDGIMSGNKTTSFGPVDPFLWGSYSDVNQTVSDVWVVGFYSYSGSQNYVGGMDWQEIR